jgi:hypothetical protein
MSSWGKLGISLGLGIAGFALMGPVGFSLGFLGGTVVGSMIFPEKQKGQYPSWGDYPVQTAEKGTPIPEVSGTRRVAGNIIWMGPLTSQVIEHSVGKGGPGSEQTSYEVRYYRSFLIGVCMGTTDVARAWAGKDEIDITKFTWFDGEDNTGIPELTGEEYTTYKKLACAFFDNYYLGNTQTIPNFVFEVGRSIILFPDYIVAGTSDWGLTLDGNSLYEITAVNFTRAVDRNFNGVFVSLPAVGYNIYVHDKDYNLLQQYQVDGTSKGDAVFDLYNPNILYYGAGGGDDGLWKFDIRESNYIWRNLSADRVSKLTLDKDGQLWGKGPQSGAYSGIRRYDTETGVMTSDYCYGSGGHALGDVICIDNFIFSAGNIASSKNIWRWNRADVSQVPISGLIPGFTYISKIAMRRKEDEDGYWIAILAFNSPSGNPYHLLLVDGDNFLVVDDITLDGWLYASPAPAMMIFDILGRIAIVGSHNAVLDCNMMVYQIVGDVLTGFSLEFVYLKQIGGPLDSLVSIINYPRTSPVLGEAEDISFSKIIEEAITTTLPEVEIDEDNFATALAYCEANNLRGSFYFKEQKPFWDWIDYICSHFNAFRYRSNGKLCLGIFREQDSIATLTKDDFVLPDKSDARPIVVSKRKYKESYNRIEVNWTDRDNDYASSVAPASDVVDKRISAIQRKNSVRLDGITNGELAQTMAYRLLAESLYRIHYYAFNISFKNSLYEINDVLTLNDGIRVIDKKVRVIGVQEHLTGLQLSIEAIEEITYPNVLFGKQSSEHTPDTTPVLDDGLVEFREDYENARIYLNITPTSTYTNGWWVYLSYDNYTYEVLGMCGISGITDGDANSQGSLISALPAHPSVTHAPDESFQVNIGTLTDLRTDITDDEFFNNRVLAKIEDEIIAYRDCVETATPGIWEVSNLIRGLFGTEAVAHGIDVSGEYSFKTLKSNFSYAIQPSDIGKTLYFKVISYYAEQSQLLSEVDPYEVQITGEYARPGGVSLIRLTPDELDGGGVTYSGASFTLYWNLPGQKGTGFNQGGFDLNVDYPIWEYGDDESELVGGNGVTYGNYVADSNLQGIDLVFEQTDGTFISERSVAATATYTTITKATDLGGFDSAVIKVIPKTSYKSTKEASITVTQV